MKIREHLRSNAVAYVALFFALSGSARAANTVFSEDIVNGEVKRPDIAGSAVNGPRLADDAVDNAKLADDSVGGAEVLDGSIDSADIEDETLNGFDISEGRINLVAAGDTGGCQADSGRETVCASTGILLGESGKLVIVATSSWRTFALNNSDDPDDPANSVSGTCRLMMDTTQVGVAQTMGERAPTAARIHPAASTGTAALTGVAAASIGQHQVQVRCTEFDGDIDWPAMNLSVQGSVG